MLTLILQELVQIRKELQTLNKSLEPKKKTSMDDFEIFYRSLTGRERNLLNWAISLEKDSDALKTIKKLSGVKKSDSIT